jgi:hypothetical protein
MYQHQNFWVLGSFGLGFLGQFWFWGIWGFDSFGVWFWFSLAIIVTKPFIALLKLHIM